MIDIKLPASQSRFLDRFLRLLLAADEQNLSAATGHFLKEIGRPMQLLHRLIEVDDVDRVALLENEGLHFRVPTLGLMTKVDTGFEEFGK